MKTWFRKLVARLFKNRTRAAQRTDWRGRPLREGAPAQVGPAEDPQRGTLRPPALILLKQPSSPA